MGARIHLGNSGSPDLSSSIPSPTDDSSSPAPSSKEKHALQANMSDIEADAYVEGGNKADKAKLPVDRADRTELTPVEALTWNVDGDQSPCKHLFLS
jgi:hypothetical protein